MIGAIKRRWKSKKAKVLHKGNELSSSSDSCPTSRGFVDGPEDFDKMIKPPSPRQVHPVLEKGDLKFHNLHHLLQQSNGNGSPHHPYILQQPPSGRKKSSTLPSSDDTSGTTGLTVTTAMSSGDKDKTGSQDGCHFIRVNSGRIELVSKDSPWKGNSSVADQSAYNTKAERFINRHLKNDVRHSWCGSAIKQQPKTCDASQPPSHSPHQSKRHSEDNNQQHVNLIGSGFRGALGSNNNNNRIYPQEELTSALQHQHPPVPPQHPPPSYSENIQGHDDGGGNPSSIILQDGEIISTNIGGGGGGTGLLSPLRERLAAIEELTTSLQSWQSTEKTEYEKCVSDLANQVSRAVALQQLMKGEVEKLQQRVVDLENHNKAMATMIIPTLMKLHDTTMGSIKDAPQLKSIEPAPPPEEEEDHQMSTSMRTMTLSDCDSLQTSLVHSQHSELSPSSSLSRSYVISRGEASASSASPSNSQNPSCKPKTICYEEDDQSNPSRKTSGGSIKREKPMQPPNSPSIMSSSTPGPTSSPSVRSSPVKAPRTSKMTSGIPKMNGNSSGNISVSSNSSLGRSNSCNRSNNTKPSHNNNQPISLIENEGDGHPAETSLELSLSSNSEISSNLQAPSMVATSRTAIPRMSSSPVRSSRIPQQGGTTPKPARRNIPSATTTAVVATNDSRSCSPQRGSRLPVRKAALVPVTRSHPAATSKSLPAHGNMNTPFQSMTRSGPEAGKHSKSTFGFGSPRKSSAIPNRTSNVPPGGRGGSSTKSNSPSTKQTQNLPESLPTSKQVKLLANPISTAVTAAVPKVSGSGKDEGYSTMSSEALAEQEHHLLNCHHHRNPTNSLEKSTTRVTSLIGAFSNNSNVPSVFTRGKVASLPKTNKIAGIGSPTSTLVPSVVDPILEGGGGKRGSIHKSNTFNTFREMDKETRMRNQSQRSYRVCDDDDEENDECDGGEILPPRNRQFTSLPTSSSSASSSPSKSKPSSGSPTKRPKSSRVTTTRMMDGNIVRIVRGSPYSIRFGEESADDMEDEEDPSSSTILWEDSDDSDILFLPLEVSESHSPTSSRSTLVPPPMSSGESRSYYSSWSRGTATTDTCKTLDGGNTGEGSNTSINNDSIASGGGGGGATYSRKAYPLTRTKGEVTVDILLGNEAGGGDSGSNSTKAMTNNKLTSRSRRGSQYGGGNNPGGGGDILINETDQVVSPDHDIINLLNNPIHDNHQDDDLEEKALIEKWMQLEEVRNEQVHGDGGEQWAWDWDGVERTYTRVLRNGRIRMRQIPVELDEDDDDIIDVDLILEGTDLPDDPDEEEMERVVEERNALNETIQIDSNTWTKSKSSQGGRISSQSQGNKDGPSTSRRNDDTPPGCSSQEASPEKMRREEGDSSAILALEGECERDGPLIKSSEKLDGVNEPSRSSNENYVLPSMEGRNKLGSLKKKAHSKVINLDEHGMVVTSCGDDDDDDTTLEENGGADADAEDDPPPVIEFTPEFYRLANYGSNLSFSDNDSLNPGSVTHSPKAIGKGLINNNNKSGPSSPSRSPKKRKHLQRRPHPITNQDALLPLPPPPEAPTASKLLVPPMMGKMDDKVSQTDFSSSSLENMSSVSSELSAECRNCLDIIKKLVVADTDEEGASSSNSGDFRQIVEGGGGGNSGAFILGNGGMKGKMDQGSYSTTWISVPKGLPSTEVDRILEILSSSESEGVLSPK